jgi:hypothetical protein
MLRCVALVRTDVSEEHRASFMRVTRIGELGTTLPTHAAKKCQKTPFFIVIAVKTSNIHHVSKNTPSRCLPEVVDRLRTSSGGLYQHLIRDVYEARQNKNW